MLGINLKHSLATVAVAAGCLAAAGPASAATQVLYNGHAGLGAPAALSDGTSNTIMFGEVVDSLGVKYTMFLPLQFDATKNEVAVETLELAARR